MQKSLKEVAEISLGKSIKTKPQLAETDYNAYLVQISELNKGGLNKPERNQLIDINHNDEKFFLKKFDILIPLKGYTYNSDMLLSDTDRPIFTNSSIAIIRPYRDCINPFYLLWYLNQPALISYLMGDQYGSAQPFLKKSHIESLPIEVIPMTKQNLIASIIENWHKQKIEYENMLVNGSILYNAICSKIVQENSR